MQGERNCVHPQVLPHLQRERERERERERGDKRDTCAPSSRTSPQYLRRELPSQPQPLDPTQLTSDVEMPVARDDGGTRHGHLHGRHVAPRVELRVVALDGVEAARALPPTHRVDVPVQDRHACNKKEIRGVINFVPSAKRS